MLIYNSQQTKLPNFAYLFLPLTAISLLFGLLGGLARIGWNLQVPNALAEHGALMVGSFMCTLIMIERTAAFRQRWVWLFPALNLGSLPLFLMGEKHWAVFMLLLGSIGLLGMVSKFYLDDNNFSNLLQLVGAVCYCVGNTVLLLSDMYPKALFWWMAFVLFIIVGERLYLTRFLPMTSTKKMVFGIFSSFVILGLLTPYHSAGRWLLSMGFVLIPLWLLQFDMALKSIRISGQHRYTGLMLIAGYGWLLVCGIFMAVSDFLYYDIVVHSFFLGFGFCMIFAHGPIIFPGVLGMPIKPYRSVLYLWGVLLSVSLCTRIWAVIFNELNIKRWAGIGNAIAILGFLLSLFSLIVVEIIRYKKKTNASKRLILERQNIQN